MILAITPNPALDVTYRVDATQLHEVNRVREVRTVAGGKGVNVAKVLLQLGEAVTCAGPLGGPAGDELRRRLAQEAREIAAAQGSGDSADHPGAVAGHPGSTTPTTEDGSALRQAWTDVEGATRRTLAVVDGTGATGLYEPGPELSPAEVQQLLADVDTLVSGVPMVDAVTVSGSLPGGMGEEHLTALIESVRAAGLPILVDTSGPGLLVAARAGATLLKPNAEEAMEATGEATPLEAARALCALGAGAVVCSLGDEGMLGLQPPGAEHSSAGGSSSGGSSSDLSVQAWKAQLPRALEGNPTGAGDSVVATLASTVLRGRTDLPTALRRAVAVGASAVTRPVAGEIDAGLAADLEPTVQIHEV